MSSDVRVFKHAGSEFSNLLSNFPMFMADLWTISSWVKGMSHMCVLINPLCTCLHVRKLNKATFWKYQRTHNFFLMSSLFFLFFFCSSPQPPRILHFVIHAFYRILVFALLLGCLFLMVARALWELLQPLQHCIFTFNSICKVTYGMEFFLGGKTHISYSNVTALKKQTLILIT